MSTFVERIEIAAPPAVVWDVMTRFERWPEWTASVAALAPLGGSPPGLGARYRIEQPSLQPAEWTITAWEPGRAFTWESRRTGMVAVAVHTVTPSARGCEVEMIVRYEGLLGPLVGMLAAALTRRYMAMEAAGLRARAEVAARA
ncbi:MAG: SRPBCC family protein [Candidatus Eisenbacteria bacterium]|uniref:SRPBCC family protein n=1 Tax=Eiseniibacteriota bacterium TaxID=2212470 RepID=A0A933W3F8_UNCEI|nr:SRPBCC family protein [Candidatus Eisenbacteria bacterium]